MYLIGREESKKNEMAKMFSQFGGLGVCSRSHLSQLEPLTVLRVHLQLSRQHGKDVDVSVDGCKLNGSWASFHVFLRVQSEGEQHQENMVRDYF